MKLTRELLESFGIITEATGENTQKEAKVTDEGVKETEKLIKPDKEEKHQEGYAAQEELSVNPEVDDRKKEISQKEKLDKKEEEKWVDGKLEEAIGKEAFRKINSLIEETQKKEMTPKQKLAYGAAATLPLAVAAAHLYSVINKIKGETPVY